MKITFEIKVVYIHIYDQFSRDYQFKSLSVRKTSTPNAELYDEVNEWMNNHIKNIFIMMTSYVN